MAEQRWGIQLASLSPSNLLELRQEIDHILSGYDHLNILDPTYTASEHSSIDDHHYTFCSSAPTLQQSGRSTPQANSVYSDHTTAFDSGPLYAPGVHGPGPIPSPRHLDGSLIWPSRPATYRRDATQPGLRRNTVRKTYDESKRFFCTFCHELGIPKPIRRKEDWKRHEEDYHSGTGNEWHCQVKGCSGIFLKGADFKQHLKIDHQNQVYPRDSKEVVQQHRVYACGFGNCNKITYTWKDRCDHVATCMAEGEEWSYDRTIRVLLKHFNVAPTWKQVYTRLGPQYNIIPSKLSWDLRATHKMREQLEYHNFGLDLEQFLESVFLAGHPKYGAHALVAQPMPIPAFSLPNFPGTVSGGLEPLAAPSGDTIAHATIDPTLVQSSHSYGNTESAVDGTSSYRNSFAMMDTLPIAGFQAQSWTQNEAVATIPPSDQELLSFEDVIISDTPPHYSSNPTPPLPLLASSDDEAQASDSRRSSPRRIFTRKSLQRLTTKKSQHLQHPIIQNPDVPPNSRLHTAPSRKTSSTSPSTSPTVRIHSYQS